MRSTGPLALLGASALVLVLAGCAGGSAAELTWEDSPLNKYLASAYGGDLSTDEQQKLYEEQMRAQEELMAECMADEGFEYTPSVQSGGFISSDDVKWEPEDKAWVEKYGYGMVNSPYNEQSSEETAEEYVDPNQEYIESLSESEQTAYYETAYGAAPDEDELAEDGSYEYNWENAGCQGWAQNELQGEDPWSSDEFADLRTKMEELWNSTAPDPDLVELNAAWAACMDEKGEPGFTSQSDAMTSISDEQSKLYDAAYGDGTTEIDPESFVDPTDSPEMKALGEREIELALVDLECRDQTSYAEKSLQIQFALEEQFIADNKAELEAFKAAAEQNS